MNIRYKTVLFATCVLFLTVGAPGVAFSQEDHGPHAGYVRRSGEAISELVTRPNNTYEIYLLDAEWSDLPPAENAVELQLRKKPSKDNAAKAAQSVHCKADRFWFRCELPKEWRPEKGDSVIVLVENKSKKKTEFVYEFPFAFSS